ncbi:MAG: selenium cofactor biosynthesis protein YqeC [Desulfobacterales bacterium]|nr:selenium cofactor biosynthesis protein YqeC [Desulfobacterales bacterium]
MDPDQKVIDSIIEKSLKGTRREREGPGVLSESLGLKTREVISLTGAGGKTTLMFRLARELFLKGKKVVTTTTTKILEPASGETVSLFINLAEEELKHFVHRHLDEYKHITIARERLESGKLKGVSSDLVNDFWSSNEIDYIIIEADGAAGRPVKAPREGEPVIPSSTTLVVAILGVDGVEREVNEENVFQVERVSKLTGIPVGKKMTDEAMAILMTHPEGIFKGAPSSSRVIAFLNKVDIPNGVVKAKGIARKIIERKHLQIERVVLGQLRNEPPVVEVIFPS